MHTVRHSRRKEGRTLAPPKGPARTGGKMSWKAFRVWARTREMSRLTTPAKTEARKEYLEKLTKGVLAEMATGLEVPSSPKKADLVSAILEGEVLRDQNLPELPKGYTKRHYLKAAGIKREKIMVVDRAAGRYCGMNVWTAA